jgi:pimeloyl-ACP methyl ester carboxylesterase
MQFRTSPKGIASEFENTEITPMIKDVDFEGKNFRYVEVSDLKYTKTTIVFIHGAPGSSDNYFQFMSDPHLVSSFDMVSIDRLGYGYSDFGNAETSLEKQAESLLPLLEEYSNTTTILVGHSFGGPIAAKAAVLYPELVGGILLLAPAIDPENEKIVSIAWMGKTPPFRWITPRSWKVATDEKFSHVEELKKMLPDWSKICIPVTYIQGDEDRLVPYQNLAFAERMIDDSCLKVIGIPGEDHFLPWSQEELIKKELMELGAKVVAHNKQAACND